MVWFQMEKKQIFALEHEVKQGEKTLTQLIVPVEIKSRELINAQIKNNDAIS